MVFRRLFVDKRVFYCLVPSILVERDVDILRKTKTGKELLDELRKERESMTGKDRLYIMFSTDEFGAPSPEINVCMQSVFFSALVGVVWGGFVRSKNVFNNFMQFNQATQFQNHLDAKKKLQDQVTMGFMKGAWQFGWRLTAFTGSYMLLTTSVAAYRGKYGIREHCLAGFLTGAAYKMSLGVKGIVVGGGLGLVLGTIAGSITVGMLKILGIQMDELYQLQYRIRMDRTQLNEIATRRRLEQNERVDQNRELIAEHDLKHRTQGLDLSSVDENVQNESTTAQTQPSTPTVSAAK